MRQRIAQWLGLPVCVGIAPTKTLAKLANHIAKKRAEFDGVCDLTRIDQAQRERLLGEIEVGEVWGIGRQLQQRLQTMGIHSVRDLRDADAAQLRQMVSVVLERTVRELRGISCLSLEEVVPAKQQIMVSRSFGHYVYTEAELASSLSTYTARAAEKLRKQRCVAGALTVYLRTNPFKPETPQYQRNVTIPLAEPTADTVLLTRAALKVLKHVFRAGYAYQKSGVTLSELYPVDKRQASLFQDESSEQRSQQLMATLDKINQKFGRSTIRLCSEGQSRDWRMKREKLSPAYTTRWDELPSVQAK